MRDLGGKVRALGRVWGKIFRVWGVRLIDYVGLGMKLYRDWGVGLRDSMSVHFSRGTFGLYKP